MHRSFGSREWILRLRTVSSHRSGEAHEWLLGTHLGETMAPEQIVDALGVFRGKDVAGALDGSAVSFRIDVAGCMLMV